jgi:hypothetical protein
MKPHWRVKERDKMQKLLHFVRLVEGVKPIRPTAKPKLNHVEDRAPE